MFVADHHNNIRRRCDISGGGSGRHWVVMRAMRISGGHLCCLVRHDTTGEWRVATWMRWEGCEVPQMTSIY